MNLSQSLGSFIVWTVIVGFAAWWRTRRYDNGDAATFFLAKRQLPWYQVAGALLLTNLSTEQIIGLNGAASVHGAVVIAWEVISVFALIALVWYFLPRYWSGNITTVPEFLEQRFDRQTRRLMGVVFLIMIVTTVLPFILYTGGVAIDGVFGLHQRFGISSGRTVTLLTWAIGLAACAYVVLGGMKAVALADTLYGIGILIGGLLVPYFGLRHLGDGDAFVGMQRLMAHQGAKLNPIGAPDSNVPFSTLFTGMLLINLFYWCTNQMIVQRTFGAKSLAEAQKGVLATAGLKLLGPFYLVLPGIIAAEMFAGSVGNGDWSYARLIQIVLPEYLVGFFAAALVGSIISAFNGGLHSVATVFSMDIYRSWIRPLCSDAEMVRAGKIFAVVMCIGAILLAGGVGDSADGIFTLMKRIMAAFKLPLLAVVLMGMLMRGVPTWAAKVTLTAGGVMYYAVDWLCANRVFGLSLHWLHVAGLSTALLCAFLAFCAWATPARTKSVRRTTEPIKEIPALPHWSGLRPASYALSAAATVLYYSFWRLAA
jgi:SSS family solute:Na+ symporter